MTKKQDCEVQLLTAIPEDDDLYENVSTTYRKLALKNGVRFEKELVDFSSEYFFI